MDHFWRVSRLSVSLTEIWLNMTECTKTAQKWLCGDKYGPNLSYLDIVTNTGQLYSTLELIWPNLSQTAVHAITWYTRPRSLNSDLRWTNSFKLDILDNCWPPLPTTGNTVSVVAILFKCTWKGYVWLTTPASSIYCIIWHLLVTYFLL